MSDPGTLRPRQFHVPDPRTAAPSAGSASPPGPTSGTWSEPAPPAGEAPSAKRGGSNRGRSPVGRRGLGGPGRGAGRFLRRALRPKLRWAFLYLPLAIVLVPLLLGLYAVWQFSSIHRVDLGDALTASARGTNYLIVGSDSRANVTDDTPNSGAMGSVAGSRSDTLIVLHVEGDKAVMVSIPRDLWVTNAATGKQGRVNAAYNTGPANLVNTITKSLGIPIDHYLEVDFVSFAGIVDALGGVEITFKHPAYDRHSGLNIIAAGKITLDGTQALAYVRSRHYVEIVDGTEQSDPTGDIGRQERQQTFIRTVLNEIKGTRNPIKLAKIAAAATEGMRVDDELGSGDVWSLIQDLAGTTPTSLVLPTTNAQKGQASVLLLKGTDALPVLAALGA